jgi:tetratricopeptide (TPR) repeat protein
VQYQEKKLTSLVSPKVVLLVLATMLACAILTIGPTWAQGYQAVAKKQKTTEKPPSAIQMLDKGEFEAAAGRFDQAKKYWQHALELKPGWPVVKRRLSELPARKARFPLEQETRRKRVQARLDFVEGITQFNAQHYREAAELFAQSHMVIPEDTRCAECLELARQMQQAMQVGNLEVTCPAKAKVFLDYELRGSTPLKLFNLTVGMHNLEVINPRFSAETEIEIKPRALTSVKFKLLEQ